VFDPNQALRKNLNKSHLALSLHMNNNFITLSVLSDFNSFKMVTNNDLAIYGLNNIKQIIYIILHLNYYFMKKPNQDLKNMKQEL